MAARGDRSSGQSHVLRPVVRNCQEVEHRPVVPDVEMAEILDPRSRRPRSIRPARRAAQSRRAAQRGLGEIKDGDPLERTFEQPIHQDGGPAADVDDTPALRRSDGADELERGPGFVLVPAHFRRGPGRCRSLPSGPCGRSPSGSWSPSSVRGRPTTVTVAVPRVARHYRRIGTRSRLPRLIDGVEGQHPARDRTASSSRASHPRRRSGWSQAWTTAMVLSGAKGCCRAGASGTGRGRSHPASGSRRKVSGQRATATGPSVAFRSGFQLRT